jgi:hypothetical protein
MASTEQRTGFRLPWGSGSATDAETPASQADHPTDEAAGASNEQETGTMGMTVAEDEAMTAANAAFAARDEAPASTADPTTPSPQHDSATPSAAQPDPWAAQPTAAAPVAAPRQASGRPPSRFLADLVRAMRSTAEENRDGLVESLLAEGKTSVEQIHARSAEEVDGLRRVADEDVAGIKDWSKAEIARIRTETEERIAERKQELELSLEGHAALIEREIEHVQARIAEYEAEMDAFFARLEAIDDPSEFASVAAEMPEPPSLEEASTAARAAALDELIRETTAARVAPAVAEPVAEVAEPVAEAVWAAPPAQASEPAQAAEPVEAVASAPVQAADPVQTLASEAEADGAAEPIADAQGGVVESPEVEAVEAVAEVQAAEAVVEPEPAVAIAVPEPELEPAAAVAEPADQPIATDTAETSDGDPRLAALGLSADGPDPDAASDEPQIDAMNEATIAARLGDTSTNGRSAPESTTSVVVIGLVSVASVAAFKRTLGKVSGVRSVGVSSGPEGEFVFRTTHDGEVALKDVIPTLPGFGARVVAAGEGVVNVSARDPETEA